MWGSDSHQELLCLLGSGEEPGPSGDLQREGLVSVSENCPMSKPGRRCPHKVIHGISVTFSDIKLIDTFSSPLFNGQLGQSWKQNNL